MPLKIIFLGTPQAACPFLEGLASAGFNIAAAITQPDRKIGRKQILSCPAVKSTAMNMALEVFQPENSEELLKVIKDFKPDIGIVVAYGKILKSEVLSAVPLGFINVHFSLLPKYRGAAPVRWALACGEKETGVTIFKIDKGMDTGDVLMFKKTEINEEENAVSLFERLISLGKEALLESLKSIEENRAVYSPQTGVPSYAKKIEIEDTFINFNDSADKVYDFCRAFCFDPLARFKSEKFSIVQIVKARKAQGFFEFSPKTVCGFEKGRGIFIKCGDGALFLERIKPSGKSEMSAFDFFVNGGKVSLGDKICE